MKVAALAILGILLYMAAAEGNLGSLLAVFIDPAALGDSTSPGSYNTSDGQPPLTDAQTKALIKQQSQHPGRPASLSPNPDGTCPTGFAHDATTGQCVFVRTR